MRTLAALVALLCATGAAGQTERRYRNDGRIGRISSSSFMLVTAALTSDNCTGASQSLSDGTAISWTRATTATCTKNDGTLTTVSSGAPRCNSGGCLVEPAATNLMLRSDDTSNAVWTKQSTTIASAASAIGLPFWTLTTSATNGDVFQLASGTYSTAATASAWVRAPSGTVTPSVGLICTTAGIGSCSCARSDGAACSTAAPGTGICISNTTVGTTPVRIKITGTCAGTTNMAPLLAGGQYSSSTGAADFAGIQFETGSVATSYIPTTSAAVTRNADVTAFTSPAWFSNTQGCISETVMAYGLTSGDTRLLENSVAVGGFQAASATSIRFFTGTFTNTSAITVSSILNRSVVLIGTWMGSTSQISADGVAGAAAGYNGAVVGSGSWTLANTAGNALYGQVSNIKLGSTPTACQ